MTYNNVYIIIVVLTAEYLYAPVALCRRERLSIVRGEVAPKVRYNKKNQDRDVAQFGSAPRLGRGGRTFESCHPDHLKKKL